MLGERPNVVDVVTTAGAEHTFKTSFDIVWEPHHSTEECICSTVHHSATSTKCTNDTLGFARAICVTLDLDLNLRHVIR
jgi:hypothetical protein